MAPHRRDCSNCKPGKRVLEIGCGWGGFAEFAARAHGCQRHRHHAVARATCLRAQRGWQRRGCRDSVDMRLQDYRDVSGQFDRIASIEMFEAVGEEHWPTYFAMRARAAEAGGIAVLQIITIDDDVSRAIAAAPISSSATFFPAACCPRPTALQDVATRPGLGFETARTFANSYARNAAPLARSASTRAGRPSRRSASTNASSACGTIISPLAKAAFAPAQSMWGNFALKRVLNA